MSDYEKMYTQSASGQIFKPGGPAIMNVVMELNTLRNDRDAFAVTGQAMATEMGKMEDVITQLRADLARVTGERDRWRAAAVDIRIVAMERWSFDGDQQHTHTWHDRADFAAWSNQKLRDTITPPTGG